MIFVITLPSNTRKKDVASIDEKLCMLVLLQFASNER